MKNLINREPVVNGRFYPSDSNKLTKDLHKYFKKNKKPKTYKEVNAIISPHAGYVFSGEVAASAFCKIDPNTNYENIFVIAPSHHVQFNGASIYNIGNYKTPLGEVEVNLDIANQLMHKNSLFNFYADAHKNEHSLEVQLPFVQYWFKNPYKLIPIVVGTQDNKTLKKISDLLQPWFNKKNLFIISSDFSHFPDYEGAKQADKTTSNAILEKSTSKLLTAVKKNKKAHIDNLSTSACGLSGILILLNLIDNNPKINIQLIKYMNSGNSIYGDHSRVVGYMSFVVYNLFIDKNEFSLTNEEKKQLLNIARQSIHQKLTLNKNAILIDIEQSKILKEKCGVFVTINKGNELRGCIGRFSSDKPLHQLVEEMAVASAFYDSRFLPVKTEELDDLTIEISVLSPLQKIDSINDIIIGTHGIYIKQGFNTGTLLPKVAVNNNWSVEEFLGYCSKNKAGIDRDGWKTADVFTYTANVFSE